MKALSIASSGMLAQQLNVEVISNNIANMTTTGFKRQRAEFQDLLYQNMRRVGSTSSDTGTVVPAGVQIGAGVKTASVYRVGEQGTLQNTGNQLDLAINGKGFFQVELPSGETGYTRAGSFQLNAEGLMVTEDGYTLQPGISITGDVVDITINDSGEVLVKVDGQQAPVNAGQLELVTFPNEAGLESIGDNLAIETPASGTPLTGTPGSTGFGRLIQGSLEASNVNIVNEITSLITAQRAYEMNSRVISAADDMMNALNQVR